MGHLVEAAAPPLTDDGHTLIMLHPAGAVEALSLPAIRDYRSWPSWHAVKLRKRVLPVIRRSLGCWHFYYPVLDNNS